MNEAAKEINAPEVEVSTNLERLIENIIDQGKKEATSILAEAESEARKILESAEEKAQLVAEEVMAEAQRLASEERARTIGRAQRVATKERLGAKAKVLKDTSHLVYKRLSGMNQQVYANLMRNLLLQAVQSGSEVVHWAGSDLSAIGKKIVDQVNTELKEAGRCGKLTVGEAASGHYHGGFILRGENYEVNATTDVLTEIFFEEHEPEIARMLFGDL